MSEGVADTTSSLTLARHDHPDDPDAAALQASGMMRGLATWRTLMLHDPEHAPAADILLKARHAVLSDPEGMADRMDGSLMENEERVYDMFERASMGLGVSPATATSTVHFARQVLDGAVPTKTPYVDRDSAVTLLRIQMELEKNSEMGADNHLSRMMPELWKGNPGSFQAAQSYMKEEYGIEVLSPLRQMEGMQAGAAAHEAAAKAGPARPKPPPGPKM